MNRIFWIIIIVGTILLLCSIPLSVALLDSNRQIMISSSADALKEFSEKDIAGKIDDLMGYEAFYYEKETPAGFKRRVYMLNNATAVGESWGYQIDDHIIDFNQDGLTDLICNTVAGGDGHRECYVYTVDNIYPKCGRVDKRCIEDLDDWGSNAIESWYDTEKQKLCVVYSQKNRSNHQTIYLDMDQLQYTEWNLQ